MGLKAVSDATFGEDHDGKPSRPAARAAAEQLAARRSEIRELPGGVRAFVEVLDPPLRLLICGAVFGHSEVRIVHIDMAG